MSSSWQSVYAELEDFAADNPKIKITSNVVAIPGDARPRFYRLFDTVRVSFLEEKFPDSLDEAGTLSRNYTEVEDEVTKLLGLAGIEISTSLNWFLHDPTNGLIRGLFDPLFNLLKGKIDAGAFEQEAISIIDSSFKGFYHSGYEKWVALSLVKLLASDMTFNVTLSELFLGAEDVQVGLEEPVPSPKESKRLSFRHDGTSSAFIVPDFIVHSAKINRYVAIRTELDRAVFAARDVTEKNEWYSINSIEKKYGRVALQPSLTVYVGDKLEDIALIADFGRFCRPDLIIECLAQKEWPRKVSLERIKLRHDILKPRLGTYIVSRVPVSEEVYKELVAQEVSKESAPEQASREPIPEQEAENKEANIHILTVGLDQSKLEVIIELMTSRKSSDADENQSAQLGRKKL